MGGGPFPDEAASRDQFNFGAPQAQETSPRPAIRVETGKCAGRTERMVQWPAVGFARLKADKALVQGNCPMIRRRVQAFIDLVGGMLLYSILFCLYHGYGARTRFYRAAQEDTDLFHGIALRFVRSPLRRLFLDYEFLEENKDRDRLTARAVDQYSDDSLQGYGDAEYTKGGDTLQEQQRGLILPMLEKFVAGGKSLRVLEIGCGNGDMLAHLKAKYSQHEYVGVDFSVKTAKAKHPSIGFVKGYALDLLRDGNLQADVVFSSSTWFFFAPKELVAYLEVLKKSGVSRIILSDPSWAGYEAVKDGPAFSRHLEGACWFHNYCGYLAAAGYRVDDFRFFPYRHPTSDRPDIYITLVACSSET